MMTEHLPRKPCHHDHIILLIFSDEENILGTTNVVLPACLVVYVRFYVTQCNVRFNQCNLVQSSKNISEQLVAISYLISVQYMNDN